MRVLVTGSGGQLGVDVVRLCQSHGDDVVSLGRAELDVTDSAAVFGVVEQSQPDIIINCAAWAAVDDCETDPVRADTVNHRAVATLAVASASVGAHLVQLSTDYVFDGTKTTAYVETDQTNPLGVYGRSKLAGELAAGQDATIVRTSWLCSEHGNNMVATILSLSKKIPELRFVCDQRGNPTFTSDLAKALRQLAVARHAGLVHVTNAETVSWFEFARAVLAAAGEDPDRVSPICTADLSPPRPARRPSNSALSNQLYVASGYAPLPNFRETLRTTVAAYLL